MIGAAQRDSSLLAQHSAGVALLLDGRPRQGLSKLSAARAENNAFVWNDLAVALHENANRYETPELLADALAASDRALAFDHSRPEALFNRALILQHLGLFDDAREAWEQYLSVDGESEWAIEARNHIASLAPPQPLLVVLDRSYGRAQTDAAIATSLVSRDAMSARGVGIKDVLGRWGRALTSGDERAANAHLAVARQLGVAVARRDGDLMLKAAVATIDAADDATRRRLAVAHGTYDRGLTALQQYRAVEAETMLRRAENLFEELHSPMVLAARYFAANAVFEQGRHDDAAREYESLLPMVKPDFEAYRALVLWQVGTTHILRAEWGAAIDALEQSASTFEHLGEIANAGSVYRLLAFVHDRIGDSATAWKYHVAALRGIGPRTSVTLEKEVSSIADAAILRHDWDVAASFLSVQIAMVRRLHDQVQLAATLLIRAVVRDRLKDGAGASSDIYEANAVTAQLPDTTYRDYFRVESARAKAMLTATSPAEADTLLTDAIDFAKQRSDSLNVPQLLLQRARARRSAGFAGVMPDLEQGIEELERRRRSLPENELRWGAFCGGEELFEDAIEIAIATNDAGKAFRFAERQRARSLIESYRQSPILELGDLPADTIIVEYAVLASKVVIFVVDQSGARATTVACSREQLAKEIDAASHTLRDTPSIDANVVMRGLHQRLLAPIESQILRAATIVFVPEDVTASVPFAAMVDAQGEYLLVRHAIVVSPSAAVFAAAAQRRRNVHRPASVLVLSNADGTPNETALPHVTDEARRIERCYPRSRRLENDSADLDALTHVASEVDVIHFGGHAVGDDRGIEPASILLRQNGRARHVSVAEIAHLTFHHTFAVVLAGCSTARGERRAAEGVMSVAHGFLMAGAPSVIATLWPIDDEAAARFFPRLHEKLAAGLPPAEALRAVQLDSIRRGDVPASLWAAIQDIGS